MLFRSRYLATYLRLKYYQYLSSQVQNDSKCRLAVRSLLRSEPLSQPVSTIYRQPGGTINIGHPTPVNAVGRCVRSAVDGKRFHWPLPNEYLTDKYCKTRLIARSVYGLAVVSVSCCLRPTATPVPWTPWSVHVPGNF